MAIDRLPGSLAAFAAGIALMSSAAFAQTEPVPPPSNLPSADDTSLENLKNMERDRASGQSDTNDARLALEGWAGCVALKNASESRRVLAMDFTTPNYSRALRMLAEEDKACMSFRGTMRAGGLLFAGEMAEALLKSGDRPLTGALAKAATASATPAFSFTDKVAICVVRSVPGEVATLFGTARDSAEETTAINALAIPMGLCAKAAQATKPLSVSPSGLRAMLATAAFRSVESAKVS